jgi:hypothetical protein
MDSNLALTYREIEEEEAMRLWQIQQAREEQERRAASSARYAQQQERNSARSHQESKGQTSRMKTSSG